MRHVLHTFLRDLFLFILDQYQLVRRVAPGVGGAFLSLDLQAVRVWLTRMTPHSLPPSPASSPTVC